MKSRTLLLLVIIDLSSPFVLPLPRQRQLHQADSSFCVKDPYHTLPPPSAPRSKRSHDGEISISPDSFSPPSPLNHTQASTPATDQWWPPTAETVLTAVFRAVVTILSLLNVNFTWRIHGELKDICYQLRVDIQYSRGVRHPCWPSPALREATSSESSTRMANLMFWGIRLSVLGVNAVF